MMRLVTVLTAATLALASPAAAGDWGGAFAGLSIGYSDTDGPGGADGDGFSFGPHIGYDFDFGEFVLGGELEYDRVDQDLGPGNGNLDSIGRFKLRGGYDFGNTLGYVVVGAARASTSDGHDTGAVYGVGLSYQINDRFNLSGEVLRQEFDDLSRQSGDFDTNTFNLRTSFRF